MGRFQMQTLYEFLKLEKQHTKTVISPDCMLLRENDFKETLNKACA